MGSTASENRQWWVIEAGNPSGPFNHAYIALRLNSGSINHDTLLCRVGDTQWRPLSQWTEFSVSVRPPPPPPPMPPPPIPPPPIPPIPAYAGQSSYAPPAPAESFWTLPAAFPDMAKAICIYGMFVNPVLCVVSQLSCIAFPASFHNESPLFALELLLGLVGMLVGLVTAGLLFAGAIQLRGLRKMGLSLTIAGFAVDMVWFVLSVIGTTILYMIAASEPGLHTLPDDGSNPFIALLLMFVMLAAGVFEVSALVWLLMNGRDLSLK